MIRRVAGILPLAAVLLGLIGGSAPAAAATGLVPAPGSPFVSGLKPAQIATGDFNGDGNLDAAVASYSTGEATVLLGNGTGGLAPTAPVPTGAPLNLVAIAASDFNGDARLDVAVVSDAGSVAVLLGNGAGGLIPAPGSPFATRGLRPAAVSVGDFNGDGRSDAAVTQRTSGDVAILLGNGAGALTHAPGSPVTTRSAQPSSSAVGDFNRDGKADLAVSHVIGGDVAVLLGNGAGSFSSAPKSPYTTGGLRPGAVVAGDFTRDGKLDAAVVHVTSGDVSVMRGNGRGRLKRAPGSPRPVGTFGPRAAVAANLNSGNTPDVLVASYDGGLATMLGDGRGRLNAAVGSPINTGGLHPSGVAAGDFNKDGRIDAAVTNIDSDNVSVLLSQGLVVERRCRVVQKPSTMSATGRVSFKLFCPFAARGTVAVQVGGKKAGHARFKVRSAGDAAKIRVTLSRRGRQMVQSARTVTAGVRARAYRGTGKARKRAKTYKDALTIQIR